MITITDNPLADLAAHEEETQKWLDNLPKCVFCGEPIQDEHYYDILGEILCEYCMNEHYRKTNDAI